MGSHKSPSTHLPWWSGQMGERETPVVNLMLLYLHFSLVCMRERKILFILVKFIYVEKNNDVAFQPSP